MDKTAIRIFAIEARKILIKSAITEAGFYGITKDECKSPIQKGSEFEVYETLAGTENRVYGEDIKRRANLVKAIKEQGFDQVIEETAYTWFNRIIAIRFMEINNYLPTRVRVLSSEAGSATPDIITQSENVELNLTEEELEKIQNAKRENKYDDAFRMLFVKQCNELNEILPGLFEKTNDYMELLLKITYTSDGVVRMLVDSIPEDNFNVKAEGQVEIIGWMYQYYNTELKDDTFAKLKKNVKVTKERVPAATQLFTPDWIVRYMVENSVGRVWIEHLKALDCNCDERKIASNFNWIYYLPESQQEDEVCEQIVEIGKSYKDLKPQDIRCIDTCMGSGHILVYMFDVLMDIYRSEGFSEREAVFDILEKNICGLDIDRRAYQLSYFALMMKARGYNRVFFRGKENLEGKREQAIPQIYAIEESNTINRNQIKYFGSKLSEIEKEDAVLQLNNLLDQLTDAKEYGSILKIEPLNWDLIKSFISSYSIPGQMDIEMVGIEETQRKIIKLIYQSEIMSNKYDAVVTNPPYMGNKSMSPKLSDYAKTHYPKEKSDMFAIFIDVCDSFVNENGIYSMIIQPSFITLLSFENIRTKIITENTLYSLLHMGRGIFGIDFGSTSFTVRKKLVKNYKAEFYRLHERTFQYINPSDIRDLLLKAKENNDFTFDFSKYQSDEPEESKDEIVSKETRIHYSARPIDFAQIPTMPISYWVSDETYYSFKMYKPLSYYAEPKQGMATADNNRFLRYWAEVDWNSIGFGCVNSEDAEKSGKIWFPYNKGGAYRKWYGNNEYLLNWKNNGEDIKGFPGSVIRNPSYYFKTGLTWSSISAGAVSFRFSKNGFLFDSKGPVCFSKGEISDLYILAFVNSNVAKHFLTILAPTMDYNQGPIGRMPLKYVPEISDEIENLASECVEIAERDWNRYENSWEFESNPLLEFYGRNKDMKLEELVEVYSDSLKNDFERMRLCEEKINELFIKAYGLDREISSLVEDKFINLSVRNISRDIKDLVSYAVGCMFGRFEETKKGVVYAGGKFDQSTYNTYSPVMNNIIPITDEEYFDNDMTEMFCEWIKYSFGDENYKHNIEFIANNLGVKGNDAKQKIRLYFLTNFYTDHCTKYSATGGKKRPIYWLFDSGKQNGFKCLVYLHRYTPELAGIIRSDYLVKCQTAIENSLKNTEYIVQSASSAVDKAQATKKRDKYVKQLNEIKSYYQALSHIALQKIEINLSDGIRDNYAKFQNVEISTDSMKNTKVDLLAKI